MFFALDTWLTNSPANTPLSLVSLLSYEEIRANLSTQLSVCFVSVLSFKLPHSNPRQYMAVCLQSLLTVLLLNVFSGRFVTGLGVGSLSMAVPLYKYAIPLHLASSIYSFLVLNFRLPKFEAVWSLFNNLLSPSVSWSPSG